MAEHESALIEAMRLNTELARSLIEWVPRMLETAITRTGARGGAA